MGPHIRRASPQCYRVSRSGPAVHFGRERTAAAEGATAEGANLWGLHHGRTRLVGHPLNDVVCVVLSLLCSLEGMQRGQGGGQLHSARSQRITHILDLSITHVLDLRRHGQFHQCDAVDGHINAVYLAVSALIGRATH